MQYVGKINKNILGEYKDRIVTQNVMISNERIQHIKENHPNLANDELDYIKEILENPDYIFNDKKNADTILMVKNIVKNNKNYKMVVRLNTNIEIKGKANTIISFWNISNKKLGQYIRNEEIIFEKLDKNE